MLPIVFIDREKSDHKPFFCFLKIYSFSMIQDTSCLACRQKQHFFATVWANPYLSMLYTAYFHITVAMGAVSIHVFFSAILIVDISAMCHCRFINPIHKVLWQFFHLTHFLVDFRFLPLMFFLQPLFHDSFLPFYQLIYWRNLLHIEI